jgi:hypothetical protein
MPPAVLAPEPSWASEPVGAPESVSDSERAIMLAVMRVPPDVRYRAAREIGLLDGLWGAGGVELERSLLARAHAARKLEALEEALAK